MQQYELVEERRENASSWSRKTPTTYSPLVVKKDKIGYGWNVTRDNPKAHFISVSGVIAAGKTTLVDAISRHLKIPKMEEPVKENSYLDEFYKHQDLGTKPNPVAFSMQIFLLNARYRQHQSIIWGQPNGAIQDRSIYEDPIFAKMLCESGSITKLDYSTYMSTFNNMLNHARKPDIIVHLDVSIETAMKRIESRGRKCEKGMPEAYMKDLMDHYEDFLSEISRHVPVIRLTWDENLENPEIYEKHIPMIADKITETINDFRDGNYESGYLTTLKLQKRENEKIL